MIPCQPSCQLLLALTHRNMHTFIRLEHANQHTLHPTLAHTIPHTHTYSHTLVHPYASDSVPLPSALAGRSAVGLGCSRGPTGLPPPPPPLLGEGAPPRAASSRACRAASKLSSEARRESPATASDAGLALVSLANVYAPSSCVEDAPETAESRRDGLCSDAEDPSSPPPSTDEERRKRAIRSCQWASRGECRRSCSRMAGMVGSRKTLPTALPSGANTPGG